MMYKLIYPAISFLFGGGPPLLEEFDSEREYLEAQLQASKQASEELGGLDRNKFVGCWLLEWRGSCGSEGSEGSCASCASYTGLTFLAVAVANSCCCCCGGGAAAVTLI